ncbi:transposase [Alphaproteobacteria bacterium HT1-32]|nr:transposase [Alphaproteobacteria bacterium HT1-32]
MDQFGPPEIMNNDQASQITGAVWITMLIDASVRVFMDGRARYLNDIYIARPLRSLKQEAIYLTGLQGGFQAQHVIEEWIGFYNTERPHSALEH